MGGYEQYRPGFESKQRQKFVSSPKLPDWLWGPPSLIFHGNQGYFTGVKGPGRKIDTSLTSRVEVKKKWRYTSTSQLICLHGVDRENIPLPIFPSVVTDTLFGLFRSRIT